jgi:hypothetical protein
VGNREASPSQPDATTTVAGVHHFHFGSIADPVGADLVHPLPFSLGVEAHDPDHSVVTTYGGTASLTSSTGTAQPTSLAFTSGAATTNASVLFGSQTAVNENGVTLTCADGALTGQSSPFNLRGKGDPTGDGAVNVFDVLRCVNIALGKVPPDVPEPPRFAFQFWASDMPDQSGNVDAMVNVFDVLRTVNKALGTTMAASSGALSASAVSKAAMTTTVPQPVEVSVTPAKGGAWDVQVGDATNLAGVQFDLSDVQARVSLTDMTMSAGWQMYTSTAQGKRRVIAFQPSGQPLAAEKATILRLAGVRGRPQLYGVLLADGQGQAIPVRLKHLNQ